MSELKMGATKLRMEDLKQEMVNTQRGTTTAQPKTVARKKLGTARLDLEATIQ